jgi:hypothetical protein
VARPPGQLPHAAAVVPELRAALWLGRADPCAAAPSLLHGGSCAATACEPCASRVRASFLHMSGVSSQFVDLMYLANISTFIFDDAHSGYYIHGRNQATHSDTSLRCGAPTAAARPGPRQHSCEPHSAAPRGTQPLYPCHRRGLPPLPCALHAACIRCSIFPGPHLLPRLTKSWYCEERKEPLFASAAT